MSNASGRKHKTQSRSASAKLTHPHDDEHEHNSDDGDDRALEPNLAILDAEPHVRHIMHQIRVPPELATHARADLRGAEGRVARKDGRDEHEGKVCNGVVAVEPDAAEDVLCVRR